MADTKKNSGGFLKFIAAYTGIVVATTMWFQRDSNLLTPPQPDPVKITGTSNPPTKLRIIVEPAKRNWQVNKENVSAPSTRSIETPPSVPNSAPAPASAPNPVPAAAPAAAPAFSTAADTQSLIYKVPADIDKVLRKITMNSPISYEVMVNLLGSESGFKKKPSKTGAQGLGQFIKSTFMERAYKIQDMVPEQYRGALSKIVEYDAAKEAEHQRVRRLHAKGIKAKEHYVDPVYKYRFAGKSDHERDKNRAAVFNLCNDTVISLIATREHIRETILDAHGRFIKGIDAKIEAITTNKAKYPVAPMERLAQLRAERARPWTVAEVKIVYVAGAEGGAKILLAMADIATATHKIKDYTDAGVASHNTEIFNDNSKDLNPQQFRQYIEKRVGNIPLPDLRFLSLHKSKDHMSYDAV